MWVRLFSRCGAHRTSDLRDDIRFWCGRGFMVPHVRPFCRCRQVPCFFSVSTAVSHSMPFPCQFLPRFSRVRILFADRRRHAITTALGMPILTSTNTTLTNSRTLIFVHHKRLRQFITSKICTANMRVENPHRLMRNHREIPAKQKLLECTHPFIAGHMGRAPRRNIVCERYVIGCQRLNGQQCEMLKRMLRQAIREPEGRPNETFPFIT